jgi:hypothetical protein
VSVVIVCGGREYNDKATMGHVLALLRVSADITHIVVGGCRGADLLAYEWAQSRGIPCALEPVTAQEWKERGRAAGPIRNRRMLHKYAPDLVVAFPGHAGTADMVKQAKKANVMVAVVSPEGAIQYV